MKGLIFILVIYLLTFTICIAVKIILEKYYKNKKGDEVSSPKIYYITKPKKQKEQRSVIPIKATVVEKENISKQDNVLL